MSKTWKIFIWIVIILNGLSIFKELFTPIGTPAPTGQIVFIIICIKCLNLGKQLEQIKIEKKKIKND